MEKAPNYTKSFFETYRGLFLLNFSAVLIFVAFVVIRSAGEYPLETAVFPLAYYIGTNTLTDFMVGMSNALNPYALATISVLFSLILWYTKRKQWALFFLGTMLCAVSSAVFFKEFFHIARPTNQIISTIGFGFPSSHATAAAVFFFSFAYAVEKKIHDSAIVFLWILVSIGLVFLTGFSRVYLGVHFITDVLAGFALGVFWVTLGVLFFERQNYREPK